MKIKKTLINWFTGINILGLLIVSNLLIGFLPKVKLDLTRDKIYTLSEGSKTIIRKLPDKVRVDVYLSSNLPAQYQPAADDLRLILNEIGAINKGKLIVKYYDPSQSDQIKQQAQTAGVGPIQFNQMNNDKFEITEGYLGMVVNYTDKKEVIPVVGNVENLEYALLGTINNLVNPKKGNLAVSVIGEANDGGNGFQMLEGVIARVFPQVNKVSQDTGAGPDSSDLAWLVILNKGKIGESTVAVMDKWEQAGKPLIVLVDQISANDGSGASPNDWKPLDTWLKSRGVEVLPTLVADLQSNSAAVKTANGQLLSQYWYWPVVGRNQMNPEIPAVSGVDNLGFFWASPIRANAKFRTLIKSSSQAWTVDASGSLAPDSISPPEKSGMSQQTLAVMRTEGSRLVVVGDTDWLSDAFINNNRSGLTTIFNLIDYISSDETMIGIRSKNISYHPLPQWEREKKNIFRAVNLAAPLVMLLAGAGIVGLARKKSHDQKY